MTGATDGQMLRTVGLHNMSDATDAQTLRTAGPHDMTDATDAPGPAVSFNNFRILDFCHV